MVPIYHYVLAPLALLLIIGASINLSHCWGDSHLCLGASLLLLASVVIFLIAFLLRFFPLKAQDRAIRAEENLRHFALTGKLLDSRLQLGQIIALRFASDAELPTLAKNAAEKNMGNKEIKAAIVNWKEDTYRV